MSWTKDSKGNLTVWVADGKGNPNKVGDNITPPPTFDFNTSDSGISDGAYTIDLGFGLTDTNGKPLSLAPLQIQPYIVALAAKKGKEGAAYAQIRNAVTALSGKSKVDPNYVAGYMSKIAQNLMGSSDVISKSGTLENYFKQAISSGPGAQNLPYAQATVYDPTKAESFITENFNKLLRRDPTPEELVKYKNDLYTEQNKPSSASKTTYKMVNGVRTSVTSTGLNEEQWIAKQLQSTNEFKEIQKNVNNVAAQQLQAAAAANGVTLSPQEISDWTTRVAKGESIDNFKTIIRDHAALGQPEKVTKLLNQGLDLQTIYSPYKNAMAKVLEINPESITLDDPVLRSAIKPEGEMSIYDFQRTLKKDPRWQYTNNAKAEVSDKVLRVLRDFGFQA